MKRKIDTADLQVGMYVQELDCAWVDTPFLFQGFMVADDSDIEQLREHCQYIYIDNERGEDLDEPAKKVVSIQGSENEKENKKIVLPKRHTTYVDTQSVEDELIYAKESHKELQKIISNIMQDVQLGNKHNLINIKKAVNSMVESIIRNPDAFTWLTRLKNSDSYTYVHALDSSILAVTFGRHLGLSKSELEDIALGLLLADVGKMKISQEILTKPGRLTEAEYLEVQKHIDFSYEAAMETDGLSNRTLEIIQCHHERHDGNGYPKGLAGGKIPVFARMAAIVDCYDAITSDRAYNKAISQHEAVRQLYEWRNVDFQGELIEQFIQCLGVYPTGSLVELTTGQVGVIMSQNRVRVLRPKIMLILDANKVAYGIAPTVDLVKETNDDDGSPLAILRAVEPGAFGIDPTSFYL